MIHACLQLKGLEEIFQGSRTNIIIKRMGEIDVEPFKKACKQRFPAPDEEAPVKALELQSLWQANMRNPEWHPFKIVAIEGNSQYYKVLS